jgi:serine kinase of HPr protein (carbohydrate metabolism regulator)
MTTPDSLTLHATAVAVNGAGVLIIGASGSGKSTLALEMMARGADLVADDRVILHRTGQTIGMTCPDPLRGLIEARGVGLLSAEPVPGARLTLIVDMDQTEDTRMPPERQTRYLGQTIPLLHNVASRHFPAAVMQYLKVQSRHDPKT